MNTVDYLIFKYERATIRPNQLAFEAGCHPVHIRKLLQDGAIRGVKVGSRWLIPIEAAAAFLEGDDGDDD